MIFVDKEIILANVEYLHSFGLNCDNTHCENCKLNLIKNPAYVSRYCIYKLIGHCLNINTLDGIGEHQITVNEYHQELKKIFSEYTWDCNGACSKCVFHTGHDKNLSHNCLFNLIWTELP